MDNLMDCTLTDVFDAINDSLRDLNARLFLFSLLISRLPDSISDDISYLFDEIQGNLDVDIFDIQLAIDCLSRRIKA